MCSRHLKLPSFDVSVLQSSRVDAPSVTLAESGAASSPEKLVISTEIVNGCDGSLAG